MKTDVGHNHLKMKAISLIFVFMILSTFVFIAPNVYPADANNDGFEDEEPELTDDGVTIPTAPSAFAVVTGSSSDIGKVGDTSIFTAITTKNTVVLTPSIAGVAKPDAITMTTQAYAGLNQFITAHPEHAQSAVQAAVQMDGKILATDKTFTSADGKTQLSLGSGDQQNLAFLITDSKTTRVLASGDTTFTATVPTTGSDGKTGEKQVSFNLNKGESAEFLKDTVVVKSSAGNLERRIINDASGNQVIHHNFQTDGSYGVYLVKGAATEVVMFGGDYGSQGSDYIVQSDGSVKFAVGSDTGTRIPLSENFAAITKADSHLTVVYRDGEYFVFEGGKEVALEDSALNDATKKEILAEKQQTDQIQTQHKNLQPFESQLAFSTPSFANLARGFFEYQSFHEVSSLFFGEENLNAWRESVDELFASAYLGVDYWVSAMCSNEFKQVGQSIGFIEDAAGRINLFAHVEAQRSGPHPIFCEQTCRQGDCVEGLCTDDTGVPLSNYLYKISVGVQAPKDEEPVSFNIQISGPDKFAFLYPELIVLDEDTSHKDVIAQYSARDFTEVCIRFKQPPVGFNEDVCNRVVKVEGSAAAAKFEVSQPPVSSKTQSEWFT